MQRLEIAPPRGWPEEAGPEAALGLVIVTTQRLAKRLLACYSHFSENDYEATGRLKPLLRGWPMARRLRWGPVIVTTQRLAMRLSWDWL